VQVAQAQLLLLQELLQLTQEAVAAAVTLVAHITMAAQVAVVLVADWMLIPA